MKRFTYPMKDDVYYSLGLFRDNRKEMSKDDVLDMLNHLHEENMQLQEELDYYKTKCGSLETALLQERRTVDARNTKKEAKMFR